MFVCGCEHLLWSVICPQLNFVQKNTLFANIEIENHFCCLSIEMDTGTEFVLQKLGTGQKQKRQVHYNRMS